MTVEPFSTKGYSMAKAKKKPDSPQWTPIEREITTEEVLALSVGCTVNIHGEDKDGVHRVVECTVAGIPPRKKFLTYRDSTGSIKRLAIKDYPGKYYTKVT